VVDSAAVQINDAGPPTSSGSAAANSTIRRWNVRLSRTGSISVRVAMCLFHRRAAMRGDHRPLPQ
jgi:hypothetical protein